jgi:hypothetical protein
MIQEIMKATKDGTLQWELQEEGYTNMRIAVATTSSRHTLKVRWRAEFVGIMGGDIVPDAYKLVPQHPSLAIFVSEKPDGECEYVCIGGIPLNESQEFLRSMEVAHAVRTVANPFENPDDKRTSIISKVVI